MLPAYWLPYQKASFVTPAFPGYISGHSTFSRAAAEVLAAITGSPFFPGGLGSYTFNPGFLLFEQGPSQTLHLQWGTYFDAADQAGLSRLFGGIHVSADDFTGRLTGSRCGQGVWALARSYFDGSVTNLPIALTIQPLNPSGCQISFNTLRGFYYNVQSCPDLSVPFTNDPAASFQALDSFINCSYNGPAPARFLRVSRKLEP
jgi:hypothetical protein